MSLAKRHVTTAKKKSKKESRLVGKGEGLSIIIPAAGMGHRMKSYGPKALIQLDSRNTIIERQIKILQKNYPKSEIFIVVGFEYEKIIKKLDKYSVRFINNPIHENTNVLYSIGLAIQAINTKSVMLVYGDLVFNEFAIKDMFGKSRVIVDKKNMMGKEEVGITQDLENKVSNFAFGLELKWAQIAYITGRELELFRKIAIKKDSSQWFGYEGLNYVIENGGEFMACCPKKMKLLEIDTTKDLEKIKNIRLTYS